LNQGAHRRPRAEQGGAAMCWLRLGLPATADRRVSSPGRFAPETPQPLKREASNSNGPLKAAHQLLSWKSPMTHPGRWRPASPITPRRNHRSLRTTLAPRPRSLRRWDWHVTLRGLLALLLGALPLHHAHRLLSSGGPFWRQRAATGALLAWGAFLYGFWSLGRFLPGLPVGSFSLPLLTQARARAHASLSRTPQPLPSIAHAATPPRSAAPPLRARRRMPGPGPHVVFDCRPSSESAC
jgi:hypothetical protein